MPIGRLIVLSVFLPALLLCCVIPVFAHANLVASIPAAGSVVPLSPEEVVLDFSEPADPVAFSVELRDSNLNLIVGGPGTVDPALPTRLRLAVPPLPDGIYNAIWQVRSSVDGHITSGTVSFSVGANTLPPSLLPPPGTPEPAT